MSYSDRVSDWHYTGLGSVGGAALAAGGSWVFGFESAKAKYRCLFVFGGIGVGLGLKSNAKSLYGAAVRALDKASSPAGVGFPGAKPSRLTGQFVPFSAEDLNRALGLIWDGGVALGVSLSLTTISAYRPGVNYFVTRPSFGLGLGLGASVMTCSGLWFHLAGRDL